VILKSGIVFHINWNAANDFADGVRVWDDTRGILDLDEGRIRSIELLPSDSLGTAPGRLHGTVRTRHGEFTGFILWRRKDWFGTDSFDGRTAAGALSLRFDTIDAPVCLIALR
jgi:hypothetical protein